MVTWHSEPTFMILLIIILGFLLSNLFLHNLLSVLDHVYLLIFQCFNLNQFAHEANDFDRFFAVHSRNHVPLSLTLNICS